MTEPDEDRPGGPDTPPSATPTPPATSAGSEAKGDDTVALPASAPPPSAPAAPTPPPAPAPVPPPTPVPAPSSTPAPMATPAPAPVATAPDSPDVLDDDLDDYDDFDDYGAPRWVSLATVVGAGLIGVVALQVLLSLVEGVSVKEGQKFGVPDDLLHRLGYPFGSLGSTAIFFVLLGVILLALPSILGEEVTDRQYSIAGAATRTALVVGVIIGLGSLLAVRGSLHEYSAKNVAVPGYVQIQFVSFMLATVAASALTVFGAITALAARDEG
jgi:hypothetical protein